MAGADAKRIWYGGEEEAGGAAHAMRDRRRSDRDSLHGEPPRAHLIALILGTYAEIPGLSLDDRQAARLFGLRESTCRVVMKDLERSDCLTRTADGQYRKA